MMTSPSLSQLRERIGHPPKKIEKVPTLCHAKGGAPEKSNAKAWPTRLKKHIKNQSRSLQPRGEICRRYAARSEVAVFVLRHHTRVIANQDGSVYSTRCSAANAVYREDQWQRRSKHTELES